MIAAGIAGLWGRHRFACAVVLVSALGFVAAVTTGSFRLTEPESLGVFYDYQAKSLLQGRLDVPEEAIGGEAFVFRGKLYGYFGPTPALLRIPFVVAGVPVGTLARSFMAFYFVAALVAAYLILRDATRWLRGPEAEPSRWAVVALLGNAGLGSTLFFLGTRAMMFHEAILCGATFALWSCWCALRQLRTPARRWWGAALLCGLASIHARPTSGLFALSAIGGVMLWQAIRATHPEPSTAARVQTPAAIRMKALGIAGLCGIAILSFNGMSYLKFRTFDGAPLRLSRPYDAQRLVAIDGKSFHAANIPWGFYSYVIRSNFRLEPKFPYVRIGNPNPGRAFPRAKIDLPDYLLSFPEAMPGLFTLATLGALTACLISPATRAPLSIFWLAALPMSLALFAAVAIAQRYTGDFCAPFICSAAFGVAAIDSRRSIGGALARAAVLALTIVAVVITCFLIFDYQANWGPNMPESVQRRYHRFADRLDEFMGLGGR